MHAAKVASVSAVVGLFALAHAMAIPDSGALVEVSPTNNTNLMVPEDTADGVYNIYLDSSTGELKLDKLSELLEGVDPSVKLKARNEFVCEPITLVSNNIERAAYNLGQTCDAGVAVPKRGSQVAVSGSVVVYACNDAKYTTHYCRSSTINNVVSFLENNCPSYRAGQYIYKSGTAPNGNGVRTYGYTAKGRGICYGTHV